jgi:hypothetical protein
MIVCLVVLINFIALCIVRKYSNCSIDKYNHLAFISSLNNKLIIKSSAYRERNTYPPFIHVLYEKLNKEIATKYFSIVIFILNQFLIVFSVWQYFTLNEIILITLIAIFSTSLLLDVRTYNARMLGVFLFNALFLCLFNFENAPYVSYILSFILISTIILSSRFAHQMIVLVLIPSLIINGDFVFLSVYILSIFATVVFTKGKAIDIIIGHIKHVAYYYKHGIEFWKGNKYWREVKVSTDLNKYHFRIIKILFKEPIVILYLVYIITNFDFLGEDLISIYLIVGGALYSLTALFDRFDKFIGDGYRYWEYYSLAIGLALISNSTDKQNENLSFLIVLLFAIFSIYIWKCVNNMKRKLVAEGRIWNSDEVSELIRYIDDSDERFFATLPISNSNYFAVNTKDDKKFFYGYTYFGFWFLTKKKIYPYFKFSNDNLLASKYLKTVIVDTESVDDDVLCEVCNYFNFVKEHQFGRYLVISKPKK